MLLICLLCSGLQVFPRDELQDTREPTHLPIERVPANADLSRLRVDHEHAAHVGVLDNAVGDLGVVCVFIICIGCYYYHHSST